MKRLTSILVIALAATIAFTGCAKKGVDTGKLESSFKSAEPATQSSVDKAVSAIKAGNYSDALVTLQGVAAKAKLTPEQQQAIKDVVAQIQKQMAEAANKAAGDLQKSTDSMKKSLPIGK
jgi:hypothetical protein